LPLHRQAQMLASCGVIIDRGTLGGWVTRVAWWLELLYDALLAFIRSQPRVFCDETPLPRLDPGRKRTKVCQLWAQAVDDRPWNGPAPPAVAYIFAESRSAREVEGQLSSFAGVLQVDGYQAYKTMAKRRGKSNVAPMRLAFCLAHARRKFVDVVKLTGSSEALSILARIAEVYRIEAKLRGESADTRRVLNAWLEVARIDKGSIFRAIDRWGNVSSRPLDPKAVTISSRSAPGWQVWSRGIIRRTDCGRGI